MARFRVLGRRGSVLIVLVLAAVVAVFAVFAVPVRGSAQAVPQAPGELWGWGGDDEYKSLGGGGATGTLPSQFKVVALPVRMPVTDVVDADTAQFNSLAVRSDGTVWAWGTSTLGVLGPAGPPISNPVRGGSGVAVQVSGLSGIRRVVVGSFGAALKIDGTVWVWGQNGAGERGDGTRLVAAPAVNVNPGRVPGLSGVVWIGGAFRTVLAIDGAADLWMWGERRAGTDFQLSPVKVLGDVRTADVYGSSLAAVKNDGSVWVWGSTTIPALGGAAFGAVYLDVPTRLELTGRFVDVAVGADWYAFLRDDGTVWVAGSNAAGALGLGTRSDVAFDAFAVGLGGVVEITAGTSHGLARKADGSIWGWGSHWLGQLTCAGACYPPVETVPIQVGVPAGTWNFVSAGGNNSLVGVRAPEVAGPASVVLSAKARRLADVGGRRLYEVTARVTGVPVGSVVRFEVVGGPNAGSKGRVVAVIGGAAGVAEWRFVTVPDPRGPETFRVFVDANDDGALNGSETATSYVMK